MGVKIANWTYTRSPATVPRDAVRLLIGDTNPEDKQLDDDEIVWLLADNGGALNAAIAGAIGLSAIYSRDFDKTENGPDGKPRKSTSNRESLSRHYLDLAQRLMLQRSRKGAVAIAAGQSISDRLTASDTDTVRPFFRRDMMDYQCCYDDLRRLWGCC